jgi:dimeric dUTPase (all-alpha-NTP-PPase superfamily)
MFDFFKPKKKLRDEIFIGLPIAQRASIYNFWKRAKSFKTSKNDHNEYIDSFLKDLQIDKETCKIYDDYGIDFMVSELNKLDSYQKEFIITPVFSIARSWGGCEECWKFSLNILAKIGMNDEKVRKAVIEFQKKESEIYRKYL